MWRWGLSHAGCQQQCPVGDSGCLRWRQRFGKCPGDRRSIPGCPCQRRDGGGGAGQPVKVCDLLPVATVASITGQQLTQATESDTAALQSYGCYYGGAGLAGVTVTVSDGAADTFDTLMQEALALGGEQVSGLGDKAYHAVLGVSALFGDVSIFASTDLAAAALQPDDAAITLIKTLQPKL